MKNKTITGNISGVSGSTVKVKGFEGVPLHSLCKVGPLELLGEVIAIETVTQNTAEEVHTLQVYESTTGLKAGDVVTTECEPLSVVLGPGLIGGVFDGIERPLNTIKELKGDFLTKGITLSSLDEEKKWLFKPDASIGDVVGPGDIIGTVKESLVVECRIMVPPLSRGGVVKEIKEGAFTINEVVCLLDTGEEIRLAHKWPVRKPRPYKEKLPPKKPFITGQRVLDSLFPLAEGGVSAVPGGFGTGKTVVEHSIARYSSADIVVFIGCGERGNEITEVLREFPKLKDPHSGNVLSERTVVIVNTSNMPVAAREASIFTGTAIAEFYRDMGYRVALMSDSISRWAEALREISSRLEEMPGEEGYPPYLAQRMGAFFERSGVVTTLGQNNISKCDEELRSNSDIMTGSITPEPRRGSITMVNSVSPPGGDFSEPVTQTAMRFAGTLWALDKNLANMRHFPSIDWNKSYSLYKTELSAWYKENVNDAMTDNIGRIETLLEEEGRLKEIIQVIGVESLRDKDRVTLEGATLVREIFLRQNAFSEHDAYSDYNKQSLMVATLLAFIDGAFKALEEGIYLDSILNSKAKEKLILMAEIPNKDFDDFSEKLIKEITEEFEALKV